MSRDDHEHGGQRPALSTPTIEDSMNAMHAMPSLALIILIGIVYAILQSAVVNRKRLLMKAFLIAAGLVAVGFVFLRASALFQDMIPPDVR